MSLTYSEDTVLSDGPWKASVLLYAKPLGGGPPAASCQGDCSAEPEWFPYKSASSVCEQCQTDFLVFGSQTLVLQLLEPQSHTSAPGSLHMLSPKITHSVAHNGNQPNGAEHFMQQILPLYY